MAEKESKKVIKEVSDKKSESSENKEVKPEPVRSYIHIDTFLLSAVPMFGLNNMQAAGFKARMSGRHYQYDEQVFLQELKQYLNLK